MFRNTFPNATKRVLTARVNKVHVQFRHLSAVASVHAQPKFDDSNFLINRPTVNNQRELERKPFTYSTTLDSLKGTVEALSKNKVQLEERKEDSLEFNVLLKRQLKIEEEQLVEASALYQETFANLAKMGKGSSMKSAQKLLLQWYEPLVAALRKEFDDIAKGTVSDKRNVSSTYSLVSRRKLSIHLTIFLNHRYMDLT